MTDPYVLLVVLLSLVVNTLPSLTVRAFRATLGRASTQQVRAGGTAGVLLPTRLGVWDWVPQGSLDSSAGRCHLSFMTPVPTLTPGASRKIVPSLSRGAWAKRPDPALG